MLFVLRYYPSPHNLELYFCFASIDDQQDSNKGDAKKKNIIKIVSVGQFRPEKDHPLQLRAMYELRQLVSEDVWDNVSKY